MHDVMICKDNTESQNKLHFFESGYQIKIWRFKRHEIYYKDLINLLSSFLIRMDNNTILKQI